MSIGAGLCSALFFEILANTLIYIDFKYLLV